MEGEGDRNERGRDGCVASETSNGRGTGREREEMNERRIADRATLPQR